MVNWFFSTKKVHRLLSFTNELIKQIKIWFDSFFLSIFINWKYFSRSDLLGIHILCPIKINYLVKILVVPYFCAYYRWTFSCNIMNFLFTSNLPWPWKRWNDRINNKDKITVYDGTRWTGEENIKQDEVYSLLLFSYISICLFLFLVFPYQFHSNSMLP